MKNKLFFILFLVCDMAIAQYTQLYQFAAQPDGTNPGGDLIFDGTFLYGMTSSGGANYGGTIFKIKPDGTSYAKIFDFSNPVSGAGPLGSLISDGTFLYGTTSIGGSNQPPCSNGCGTIFKIKPDGTGYSLLLDFSGTSDGRLPQGSLILNGTFLYGTTSGGGTYDHGTIFKIKPDGTGYTKLYDFTGSSGNGSSPQGSLMFDGVFLYGTTALGGTGTCPSNCGTLFKIKPDGTGFSTLMSFSIPNGAKPHGSLISDGTYLYGTTVNGSAINSAIGTIFKIKPDGTGYLKLFDFSGAPDGGSPYGSLISDGIFLYGMTTNGGLNNRGVIFKIKLDGTAYASIVNFYDVGSYAAQGSLISDGTCFYGMTLYGGTTNNGTIFKINPAGLGIDDDFVKTYFTISPNPFSTQTTLQTAKVFKNASLRIYNSLGQIVKQTDEITEQTTILQRDNLPDGLYFIYLTQDNVLLATQKMVINKK